MGTKAAWTEARRARQRELIREHAPWRASTGPRTAVGKAVSSRNALRFRTDPEMRHAYDLICQFLRSGQMTPELGAVLLENELSGPPFDPFS